jgi:CelD/BcsL family acetyltransferase involved in cellulose biosynthesis
MELLELQGRPAAAAMALLSRERIGFYLMGFDPAFRYESPGTILLGHMIEEAAAEGRLFADFLRGGERYKFAWGGNSHRNSGRSFIRYDG